MEETKKPVSVYVFGVLFSTLYFMYILINIWILTSPEFIITNVYNFYILIPLFILGFISSIVLLIVRKGKIINYALSGVVAPVAIGTLLNMIGKFNNIESGVNIIPGIILLVIFSFIKSFMKYFKKI